MRIDVGDRQTVGWWTPTDDEGEPLAVTVIAPGAGNSVTGPYFDGIVGALADEGVASLRFDFLYTNSGRRAPDPAPVLMATWRAALDAATSRAGGAPLVASGKSMGGRIA